MNLPVSFTKKRKETESREWIKTFRTIFREVGLPELEKISPLLQNGAAAGLIGAGSECFGWDDEYSQDHDWGAGFQIWLDPQDAQKYERQLQFWYHSLPDTFMHYPVKKTILSGDKRVGIWNTEDFYYRFIGSRGLPKRPIEWLYASQAAFASDTNGKIFYSEENSRFLQIRSELKKAILKMSNAKSLPPALSVWHSPDNIIM